jgi:hypothetical protein
VHQSKSSCKTEKKKTPTNEEAIDALEDRMKKEEWASCK